MANQSGIAIVIKAFMPTGNTIDENFAAYGMVKAAHESGDYAALLSASIDVKVKTDTQTRRFPDAPRGVAAALPAAPTTSPFPPAAVEAGPEIEATPAGDAPTATHDIAAESELEAARNRTFRKPKAAA